MKVKFWKFGEGASLITNLVDFNQKWRTRHGQNSAGLTIPPAAGYTDAPHAYLAFYGVPIK
jgi:hypothetical protein